MEFRRLGRSGLQVPLIGFGCASIGNIVDGDAAVDLLRGAIDRGAVLLDTAVTYTGGRSEELVARAIAGRRDEVVVVTKVGLWPTDEPNRRGLSRRRILEAIETSLRRLGTDHVDLFLAHRPDPETPLEETLAAMDQVVRDGKARYVGGSSYPAWEMAQIHGLAGAGGLAPWVCTQNRFNLIDGLDDPHLLPASRRLGFGLIPFMPLASGILTGKYRPDEPPPPGTRAGDQDQTVVREMHRASLVAAERLKPWAEARGRTLTELAMGWLASHPEVSTIIPSARTLDQLDANIAAADWRLTPDEMAEARAVALGGPARA